MGQALSDLWATRQADGYSEGQDTSSGETLTEAFLCDWENRAAYKALLITATPSDAAGHPGIVCTHVGTEGKGWEEGQTYPAKALLTASYQSVSGGSSPPPRTSDLTKWHESWTAGGEAVTIGRGYQWHQDPANSIEKSGVSAVKIVPQATISLTGQAGVGATGKGKFMAMQGKVNAAACSLKGYSYAAETLLFVGAGLDEADGSDASGRPYYNVTLNLAAFSDHTWNEFWRDDVEWCKTHKPAWDEIRAAASVLEKVYVTAAFSDNLNPSNW